MKRPEQYLIDECDPEVVEYIEQLEEVVVASSELFDFCKIALGNGIFTPEYEEKLLNLKKSLEDIGVKI